MPVPANISDLSTTAGSNPPTGSETPQEGDNHLRAAYSFIRQISDRIDGTTPADITVDDLTVNGNTTIGNASSDTVTFTATPAGRILGSTYTPTAAEVTNFSSPSVSGIIYSRVNNTVHLVGNVSGTSSTSGLMQVRVTVPIDSDFAVTTDCIGNATGSSGTVRAAGDVVAETTLNALLISVYQTSGAAVWDVRFQATYRVI